MTAAVDVILGILFVANPGSSALAIARVLGLVAIVWGIAFLVTGFIVRRDAHGAKRLLRSREQRSAPTAQGRRAGGGPRHRDVPDFRYHCRFHGDMAGRVAIR